MKVRELIELLNEVDQDKIVYAYYDGDIANISDVDEMTDRVDLNITEIRK